MTNRVGQVDVSRGFVGVEVAVSMVARASQMPSLPKLSRTGAPGLIPPLVQPALLQEPTASTCTD
eukprot:2138043-Pyramimonas_sp.AAC.1